MMAFLEGGWHLYQCGRMVDGYIIASFGPLRVPIVIVGSVEKCDIIPFPDCHQCFPRG